LPCTKATLFIILKTSSPIQVEKETKGTSKQRLTLKITVKMEVSKHTHTKLFLRLSGFSLGQPGEPVPEETFTHSHISWSSIIPYLLSQSITIHGILLVQFTCLTYKT